MTTLPPPVEPGETSAPPTGLASEPESVESAVLGEAASVLDDVADRVDPQLEAEMDALDSPRRILFVHAHPDDETIGNGVTMAKYAADGAHVCLVTCTLGEEGEVLVPELEHLAAAKEDGLGRHRIGELSAAMEALGVRDSRFLGGPGRYRDSGMMGEPTNERPDCFWQASLDETGGLLADVIREVRPQVVVTYDENGGYGHPDHIQAHRTAVRGVELAADSAYGTGEPWRVGKVYYNGVPKSAMAESIRRMKEAGQDFFGMESVDDVPFAVADELITARIDGTDYLDAKYAAMRAHASQILAEGPFFAMAGIEGDWWGVEFYSLVQGQPGQTAADGWEDDLFSGVV